MDDGIIRLLGALATRERVAWDALPARSGEPPSVAKALLRDHPEWVEQVPEGLRLSERGLMAFALETAARQRGQGVPDTEVLPRLAAIAASRGPAKRELDQVYATPESTLARARRLVAAGEVQRGLCLLGDDDLTSVALHLLGVGRRVTVVDIDPDVLAVIDRVAGEHGWDLRTVAHDLRDPLPSALVGKFGCAFTDPPYAPEGFRLFTSRAVELLRPDGRVYIAFGYSRRAPERGLQKQRALLEAGLCLEAVLPDFSAYEGAESIGGHSDLYVCVATPEARSLVTGRAEGDLYTRRKPKSR